MTDFLTSVMARSLGTEATIRPRGASMCEPGRNEDGRFRATLAPISHESLEKDHRGLLLPPKVATALTAEMKNAALAMNAGLSAPKREKARIPSPTLATEPEPSVHVTIGRIEVRASSERESKPAGRPRPPSPVMRLEQYLHQRTQRVAP